MTFGPNPKDPINLSNCFNKCGAGKRPSVNPGH